MNQILQVNNNYHNQSKNKKDIVLYFIILIIVFILTFGAYMLVDNIINGNINWSIFTNTPKYTTTINLTQVDRNQLTINSQSDVGISKLTYNINNTQPQIIQFSGEKFIEEIIEMPTGENVIYVSILDTNGEETTIEEKIIVEAPKPEISLSVVGSYIKISIVSEIELSEIKYRWNEEKEKKENMATYEEKNSFEKQLEIPIGRSNLTIIAKDINGGLTEKIQQIKGVSKANATISIVDEYLHFTVVGKEKIEKVEFVFNGKKYIMNKNTFGETKTVHYKVKLIEGVNTLEITSTTESGGIDTATFEQEYTK